MIFKNLKDNISNNNSVAFSRYLAFTLAEVLIVLGIIGIIAEITIPTLVQDITEKQYKVAYKKTYSTLYQTLLRANQEQTLTPYSGTISALNGINANFNAIKQYLKIANDCNTEAMTSGCWASGETQRGETVGYSFVDNSGTAWKVSRTDGNASAYSVLVDVNGNKTPNKYGYDRFPLALMDLATKSCVIGKAPDYIALYSDVPKNTTDNVEQTLCPSYAKHACLYKSWILGE